MSEEFDLTGDEPAIDPPIVPKKRGRQPKSNGNCPGVQVPMKAKSILKLVEDLKAEGAPVPDPLNRTAKAPKPKADPYDPDRYTESVDFTKLAASRPFISQIPVGKPAPDDFIRTHETIMFANVPLCAPSGEKGQLYLLDISNEELFADMRKYTSNYFLYYTVTAEKELFLWPIVGPHPESGKWHDSPRTAALAAERAKTDWVQVSHVEGLGYVAEGPRKPYNKAPAFADFTKRRVLELAFRSFTISDFDHPYVRRCLGLSAGTVEDE